MISQTENLGTYQLGRLNKRILPDNVTLYDGCWEKERYVTIWKDLQTWLSVRKKSVDLCASLLCKQREKDIPALVVSKILVMVVLIWENIEN